MRRNRAEGESRMAEAELEEEAYAQGFQCVAGLDEVGRGPWAGPVVAAAVVLPKEFLVSSSGFQVGSRPAALDSKIEIKDSKILSPKKREELASWIKQNALVWGLGVVDVEEIDRINILKASLLAMSLALKQLIRKPDYLLIDGAQEIPMEYLESIGNRQQATEKVTCSRQQAVGEGELLPNASCLVPDFPVQRAVVKGDRLSVSIAAASIVAKVARDEMMVQYDSLYPEYGFGRHKGYGSPGHLAALRAYGPSPIHRKSFRPVRESLNGILVTR